MQVILPITSNHKYTLNSMLLLKIRSYFIKIIELVLLPHSNIAVSSIHAILPELPINNREHIIFLICDL